jgi:hypothetical protein
MQQNIHYVSGLAFRTIQNGTEHKSHSRKHRAIGKIPFVGLIPSSQLARIQLEVIAIEVDQITCETF